MNLRDICERAVQRTKNTRFNMHTATREILASPQMRRVNEYLDRHTRGLSPRLRSHIERGLVRHAFFMELVNDKVTTTHVVVRWGDRLAQDPRYSDFGNCLDIIHHTSAQLHYLTATVNRISTIAGYYMHSMVPHELPFDYRKLHDINIEPNHLHVPSNIALVPFHISQPTVLLRHHLLHNKNPEHHRFKKLYGKISVKSYLTDRAQTGTTKTNREKRWEAHPDNIQSATRSACMSVELTLVKQLFGFKNFPSDLKLQLETVGALSSDEPEVYCPITLDPFDYTEIMKELDQPTQGKSSLHVGHLNPLKAAPSTVDDSRGHNGDNVSWITEDGNRIQGQLTLMETRQMLDRISTNYSTRLDG